MLYRARNFKIHINYLSNYIRGSDLVDDIRMFMINNLAGYLSHEILCQYPFNVICYCVAHTASHMLADESPSIFSTVSQRFSLENTETLVPLPN